MRSTHRLSLFVSAGIAGLMLTALPFGFDGSTFSPVATQAWAGAENGHGNGHGNGNANGHDKHADKDKSADNDDSDDDDDADASDLGALNAAHASDTALAHANPNSRVGKIAAYKEAELAAKAATADAAAADQAVADAQDALDRTQRWLGRCRERHAALSLQPSAISQTLVPIIQGGVHRDLRREALRGILGAGE